MQINKSKYVKRHAFDGGRRYSGLQIKSNTCNAKQFDGIETEINLAALFMFIHFIYLFIYSVRFYSRINLMAIIPI